MSPDDQFGVLPGPQARLLYPNHLAARKPSDSGHGDPIPGGPVPYLPSLLIRRCPRVSRCGCTMVLFATHYRPHQQLGLWSTAPVSTILRSCVSTSSDRFALSSVYGSSELFFFTLAGVYFLLSHYKILCVHSLTGDSYPYFIILTLFTEFPDIYMEYKYTHIHIYILQRAVFMRNLVHIIRSWIASFTQDYSTLF